MLGICYGMQLICEHFGGVVKPSFRTEYGQTEITVDTSCPLFDGLEEKQLVLMSHGDAVAKLPDGFKLCAKTGEAAAVVWSEEKNIVALQFHPEVDLTENGIKMLENFLRKICAFRDTYALEDRIETSVKMIRERVGNNKVVVLGFRRRRQRRNGGSSRQGSAPGKCICNTYRSRSYEKERKRPHM